MIPMLHNSVPFWIAFNLIIFGVLWLDLKVFQREAHEVSLPEAAAWSCFWIFVALLFGGAIYFWMGHQAALEYLTAYVIEKSLSVDNLFVFLMIFSYFNVPAKYQPRVLHWGILGALVMRFILIFAGVALLQKFHWIIYIFGALLIYTGLKVGFKKEEDQDLGQNPVLRFARRWLRIAARPFSDEKFFVKENGLLYATPLFLVLLLIESSDLVFAVDSIPAVLAVSRHPFIVYTSNVFAILGLRALYFLLSSLLPLFAYLKYGISLVLIYVGVKMLIAHFFTIPTWISLCVVASVFALSIAASLLFPPKNAPGSSGEGEIKA